MLTATLALVDLGEATAAVDQTVERPIQPGAPMYGYLGAFPTDDDAATSFATMGFIWRQGSRLFVQAPAHALEDVGDRVSAPGIGEFGTVRLHQASDFTTCDPNQPCSDDYALVEIDRDAHHLVNPSVRRWGGPTGTIRHQDTTTGDSLLFYGQGTGLREVTPARTAVLIADTHHEITVAMPISGGDSGGPYIHAKTGAALATLAGSGGPTVERFVEVASAAGYNLRLVTASLAR